MSTIKIEIINKLKPFLTQRARYKIVYGGRGGGKSENIARSLIILSLQSKIRILCAREYQSSIQHSVHKLLSDIIYNNKLENLFKITNQYILSNNGSEFIFKGITNDPLQIKSLANIDYCWVEEAEKVSEKSWEFLTPTIRNPKSEIWVSFNPNEKTDPTYQKFIINPPPDCLVIKCDYIDNPFFNQANKNEMEFDKQYRPEIYNNKWLGEVKQVSEALIFKGKYEVKAFDTPSIENIYQNRFFFGVDWGFSNDPTAMIRCFVQDNCLWVDQEAGGINIEFQDLKPFIFDKIEGCKKGIIYADSSRPETIAYMQRQNYSIYPCNKWSGSVEDGIEYLKSFKKIIIHPSCENLIKEMASYVYKTDKLTNEVLPVVVDKNNHYIDALRYSLNEYIKGQAEVIVL